jgi:hypothetical protein
VLPQSWNPSGNAVVHSKSYARRQRLDEIANRNARENHLHTLLGVKERNCKVTIPNFFDSSITAAEFGAEGFMAKRELINTGTDKTLRSSQYQRTIQEIG